MSSYAAQSEDKKRYDWSDPNLIWNGPVQDSTEAACDNTAYLPPWARMAQQRDQAVPGQGSGVLTREAQEEARRTLEHVTKVAESNEGIPTEKQVRRDNSIYGSRARASSQLVSVSTPYQMYYGKSATTIKAHKKVADKVANIFNQTKAAYTEEEIAELGLNKYSGCYNDRPVRNGSVASMHAWGIAIDIDAARNPNSSNGREPLATDKAKKFWDIVEENGGHSFGRKYGRDWMHFQFAKFD